MLGRTPLPMIAQRAPAIQSTAGARQILATTAALSFLAWMTGNPTTIFEIVFIGLIGWRLIKLPVIPKGPGLVFLLCVLYVGAGYVAAMPATVAQTKDFAVIYKFVYYLAGLALLASKSWLRPVAGTTIFRFFICLFATVYTYERLVTGVHRPTVFTENNFELIPLVLMAVALTARDKGPKLHEWALLLYICALSGSRSSIIALAIGMTMLLRSRLSAKSLLQWALIIGVGITAGEVMMMRMGDGGIDSIDRLQFLSLFLYEVRDWGIKEWIFGAPAMTPLSTGTCSVLAYYDVLLSYTGEWKCYSVILHSFVMRVIFDHGTLGLLLSLATVIYLLKRRHYNVRTCLTVVGILIATGFSVSSLNNVYVALGLVFMLSLQPVVATNTSSVAPMRAPSL